MLLERKNTLVHGRVTQKNEPANQFQVTAPIQKSQSTTTLQNTCKICVKVSKHSEISSKSKKAKTLQKKKTQNAFEVVS